VVSIEQDAPFGERLVHFAAFKIGYPTRWASRRFLGGAAAGCETAQNPSCIARIGCTGDANSAVPGRNARLYCRLRSANSNGKTYNQSEQENP
jgi:hypothetical protein